MSSEQSNNINVINVKMETSVLEEKSSFKMKRLAFSSKLDWSSYIISIAKTASKKIRALIRSVKFPFPEVVIYLYKSAIRPCMEQGRHSWADAPSCKCSRSYKNRYVGLLILYLLPLLNTWVILKM